MKVTVLKVKLTFLKMKTTYVALFCCLLSARSSFANKCPKGTSVPVNETWFLKEMPSHGWKMPMISKIESAAAAAAIARGGTDEGDIDKDYCVDIDVDGFPDVTLICEKIDNKLENSKCKFKPSGIMSLFAQHVKYKMVMTDNSTYVMITACAGDLSIWLAFGKSDSLPRNTRLEITKKAHEIGFKSDSFDKDDENAVKPKTFKYRKCKRHEEDGSGIFGLFG